MKLTRFFSALLILSVPLLGGCSKDNPDEGASELNVMLSLPANLEVAQGEDVTLLFYSGKAPLETDVIVFEKDGREFSCTIKSVGRGNFTFTLPDDIESGTYDVSVRRGDRTKRIGKTVLKVRIVVNPGLEAQDGASVYGIVHCGGAGIGGVAVTDGYEVVLTDKDGVYQLPSSKKNRMVYISLPSGYRAMNIGVQSIFWQTLSSPATTPERRDFELFSDGDQTDFTMLFFGDIHLANRTKDRQQFATFTSEVDKYVSSHGSEKIYAMTLGDMTWDLYWESNSYWFSNYLADINAGIRTLTVYHTMGNHDHNMVTSVNGTIVGWDEVDWDTAAAFRKDMGPNYYSFNIGKAHFISLDDIYCKNTTGGKSGDRHYEEKVGSAGLNWLRKDLANVDKSTPVFVTMHASVYTQTGSNALDNVSELVNCFAGFEHVRFITGHTHKMWTIDSGNIHEHNSGAVCATWWWGGYYNPTLNIAQDGAPSGYRVMSFKGKDYTSYFKGTGRADSYQFRSYDRNSIKIVPSEHGVTGNAAVFDSYMTSHGGYNTASSANEILINVWDWNPKWTVEASENGKALTVTRIKAYDPLYLIAYSAYRYKSTADPSFDIYNTYHMFKAKASSPNSTVDIKVTDDEGRVYTEKMTRPKAFSIDTYR